MDTADSHDCDPRLTRGGKSVRDQGLVLVPIGQLLKPRWSITISNSVNPARALTNWTSAASGSVASLISCEEHFDRQEDHRLFGRPLPHIH
jgi:hypothetical protein